MERKIEHQMDTGIVLGLYSDYTETLSRNMEKDMEKTQEHDMETLFFGYVGFRGFLLIVSTE